MRPKGLQFICSLVALTHFILFSKFYLVFQCYIQHVHSVSRFSGYFNNFKTAIDHVDIPCIKFNTRAPNTTLKDRSKLHGSTFFQQIYSRSRDSRVKNVEKRKQSLPGLYTFLRSRPRYFFIGTKLSLVNVNDGRNCSNNSYRRHIIVKSRKKNNAKIPEETSKGAHKDSNVDSEEKNYNFDVDDIIFGDPKRLTGDKYYSNANEKKRKPRNEEAQVLWEKYKHLFKPLETLEEKSEKILKLPVTTINVKGVEIDVRIGSLGLPWYIDSENAQKLKSLYDEEVFMYITRNKKYGYHFFPHGNHEINFVPLPGLPATFLPNITVVEHREDIPGYDHITVLHDSARNYTWTYQRSSMEFVKSSIELGSSDAYKLKDKKIIPIPQKPQMGPKAYIPKNYFNERDCFPTMFPRKTPDTGIFRQPKLDDFLRMKFAVRVGEEVDEEAAPYGYYREYQNFWPTVEIKDNENVPPIRYRRLGNSQLVVSEIALGTMSFGSSVSEADAFKMLDYAYDNCTINFFDTAELYPLPASPERFGTAERILGKWIKNRGENFRSKVIISTKIASRSPNLEWLRDTSLSKENIIKAVDNSLERLGTDYIDLLQFHWPDRYVPMHETGDYEQVLFDVDSMNDYSPVPMEEQLEAIDLLIKQGKIRAWGLSNETPWGVLKFWHLSKAMNIQEPASVQLNYNLLCRNDLEKGFIELARPQNTGIGIIAYGALAGGILTGKYLEYMDATTSARLLRFPSYMTRYRGSLAAKAVQEYYEIALSFKLPNLSVMALRWVYTRPFICNTIIGASDLYQLRENVHCLNPELPITDLMERKINQVHWKWRDPLRIVQ
ncbi:oxidoreductase, aldo/keto reductase family member protein [Theileria equi strain WA]|uniref:Oxidoreductase, aldo/keto reductase family member protein n=1 Tax=Theileria equi strain WA TaxID=1537102 RepID=L1LCS7_THEEQ|nr:oxidoreductase, aldo/keto reductase family member protein [Theileria equi strain WA]EKX73084.1 oxidoreductase, aldo/keto reductase family member protein [Theileria equi strain WA]|eukprot:XP_004832536.1 oxidoreductase, aldo/keto reductase family member protein [Theileria equi strain WA]